MKKLSSLKTTSMYMKNIKTAYPFLTSINISYNSEKDYFVVTVFYKSGKNVSFLGIEEAEERLERLSILFRKFNTVKNNNSILKRRF
jgi:hypothetical protein